MPRGHWVRAGASVRARGALASGPIRHDKGRSVHGFVREDASTADGSRGTWGARRDQFFFERRKDGASSSRSSFNKRSTTRQDGPRVQHLVPALLPSKQGSRSFDEHPAPPTTSPIPRTRQTRGGYARLGVRTFVFVDDDTVRNLPEVSQFGASKGHRATRFPDRRVLPVFKEVVHYGSLHERGLHTCIER